jgi:predicted transcriptional regulator
MKLTQPTDFELLTALDEYGRNVAANLSIHLDRDRAYLNTRLPQLADYGLVRRVGPSENAGLYEITDRGRAALQYQSQYDELGPKQFESALDDFYY